MTVVAEVLAVLKADATGMKSTVNESNAILKEFGLELGVVDSQLGSFSAASMAAGAAIATGFIGSLSEAIHITTNFANTIEALQVTFDTATGSSVNMVADVEKFSISMGLSTQSVANMSTQLEVLTNGMHNTHADWMMMADVAAFAHKNIEQVSTQLARAYDMLQRQPSQGGRAGQSLIGLGLDPGELNQLTKMVKEGATADEVWKKLTESFERMHGAGERAANTFKGISASAENIKNMAIGDLFYPVIQAIERIAIAMRAHDWSDFLEFWSKLNIVIQEVVGVLATVAVHTVGFVNAIANFANVVPGLAQAAVAVGLLVAAWGAFITITTGFSVVNAISAAMNGLTGSTVSQTVAMQEATLTADEWGIILVGIRAEMNELDLVVLNLNEAYAVQLGLFQRGIIEQQEINGIWTQQAAILDQVILRYRELAVAEEQAAVAGAQAANVQRTGMMAGIGGMIMPALTAGLGGFALGSITGGLAEKATGGNKAAGLGGSILGGAGGGALVGAVAGGGIFDEFTVPIFAAVGALGGLASGLMHMKSAADSAKGGLDALAQMHHTGAAAARDHASEVNGLSRSLIAAADNAGEAARSNFGGISALFSGGGPTSGPLYGPPKAGAASSGAKADDSLQRAMEGQAKAQAQLLQALQLTDIAFSGQNSLMTEALFLVQQLTPEQHNLADAYMDQVRQIEPLANHVHALQIEYQRLSDEITRVQSQLDRPLAGQGDFERKVRDLQSHIRALQNEAATLSIGGGDVNQIATIKRNAEELQLALEKLQNERADAVDPVKAAIEAAQAKPEISFEDAIAAAGQLKGLSTEAYNVKTQLEALNPSFNEMNSKLSDITSALGKVVSANQAVKSAAEQMATAQRNAADVGAKASGAASESITEFLKRTIKNTMQFGKDIEKAIDQGIDPQTISDIITAGPDKAGKFLDALVNDTSGSLKGLLTEYVDTQKKMGNQMYEVARNTYIAIHSENGKLTAELAQANLIAIESIKEGAKGTIHSIAEALHMSDAEVERIAGDFGTMIGNTVMDKTIVAFQTQARKVRDAIKAVFDIPGLGFLAGMFPNVNGNIIKSAEGNIFHHYASGGTENHVAQISNAANSTRIWSEPETGGEAYIPLGLAKRARSMDILSQVANMFGYDLQNMQGPNISSGGDFSFTRRSSSSGGGNVDVDINVAGHVLTERELGDMIRSIIYEYQRSNSTTGFRV